MKFRAITLVFCGALICGLATFSHSETKPRGITKIYSYDGLPVFKQDGETYVIDTTVLAALIRANVDDATREYVTVTNYAANRSVIVTGSASDHAAIKGLFDSFHTAKEEK